MNGLGLMRETCEALGMSWDAVSDACVLGIGTEGPGQMVVLPRYEGGLPEAGCAPGYEAFSGTCVPLGGGGYRGQAPGPYGDTSGDPAGTRPPAHCAMPGPWSRQQPRLSWMAWAVCNQTALLVAAFGLALLSRRGGRRR